MEIVDLKAILNKEKELITVTAIIDGQLHYTADVREMGYKTQNYYAVFSDITKFDRMNEGVRNCIEIGIYKEYDIEQVEVQIDHYIWVKLDLGDLEFTRR